MSKLLFTTLALATSCALANDSLENLIELKSTTQFEQLLKEKSIVVVDFHATWCGPCRQQGPIVHDMAKKYPEICFIKIDVDQFRDLSAKYNIASIPTILYFKNGTQVKRASAGVQKESAFKIAFNELKK
ncbi:thioredoxin [Candidatus Dependentiae bacterium HGW-Dependentiae-1]|nr:MAG: thioredoxin [Candidatus Dependentiae bacterium HGW-Dependentiae-1]